MTTDHMSWKSRERWLWFAGIVVLAGVAAAGLRHRGPSDSNFTRGPPSAIQVTVAQAKTQDVPIYLSAPGTVQAWNTVAARSQVDGKLTAVDFVEGQNVREGDTLAQIDTSALKAALDQAIAKKAEDEAQLAAAEKDLERYMVLAPRQAVPQQTLDQQKAKVDQLKATVDADQAGIAREREGLSPERAISEACLLRFRPILMTTIAALLGGVPLMLGQARARNFASHLVMRWLAASH